MAMRDSTTLLYNGEHKIEYHDASHRYYVDHVHTPSVTTILGEVIAKPDLLLWPLNLALKQLEETLLSGSPITKEDLSKARVAHIQKRDKGSNTGTAVHYLVEQRLKVNFNQGSIPLDNVPQDVALAALAFDGWYRKARPKVIGTEQVVYSRRQKYVGTYDSILKIGAKTYLCDLKTTNASRVAPQGIYPDHFIQLAAYYDAYEEQRQYEGSKSKLAKIDDLMVISCKKNGVVDAQTLSGLGFSLDQIVQVWQAALLLREATRALKKQIVGGTA